MTFHLVFTFLLCLLSANGYVMWPKSYLMRNIRLAASPSDFSVGMVLELDGSPWKILEYNHIKMARAAAVIRTKFKNLLTGGVVERTFRPGESIRECDVAEVNVEYSHSDGNDMIFKDEDSDEEIVIPRNMVATPQLFTEGLECTLLMWNDKLVDVQLPNRLEFEIVDLEVNGGQKTAQLDCGLDVTVPSFIKLGERILINTDDLKYYGRADKHS